VAKVVGNEEDKRFSRRLIKGFNFSYFAEDGSEYWSESVGGGNEKEKNYYYLAPRPVDVEITAYALLTRVLRNEIAEGGY
jgi:hypothetical protein